MNTYFVYNALLICLFFTSSLAIAAQPLDKSTRKDTARIKDNKDLGRKDGDNDGFQWSRVVWGGGLSGSFGNPTSILISPSIGYRVTDHYIPGFSITYNYGRIEYSDGTEFSTSQYGGSIWNRYFFNDHIFAHAEIEGLQVSFLQESDVSERLEQSSFIVQPFLGGGYFTGLGQSGIALILLYNFNYNDQYSLDNSPLTVRISFMIF